MASSSQTACLLAAGLGTQIILPSDSKYAACNELYFDNASKLQPACFFQPRTASELATAVKALTAANQSFAVRSGGCTVRAGSNNIDGGVTIDLGLLKSVEYNSETGTAHVGSGATWALNMQHVYDELEKHQRVVGGGRVGSMGVGGYVLGGGLSIYTGRHGFACDNVVAFEVALADGSLITASVDEHQDLFRALKGGGNNFGIVARFTMRTIPSGPVWGGVSLKPRDVLPTASQAFEDFNANAHDDPDSTIILVAANKPKLGGEIITTITFNAAGIEKPKAFDKFMSLPEKSSRYRKGKIQDLLAFSELPRNFYYIWYTITFKNDAAIVAKASELLFQLGKDLEKEASGVEFNTHVAFQPIPRFYTERSEAAGGNVMGLEHYPYDAVMVQASASVKTAELAAWVRPRIQDLLEVVREFAVGRDGFISWKYPNYAHGSQDVLQSYGADNVQRIREAAARYDPEGVFQRLCHGGFKISALEG